MGTAAQGVKHGAPDAGSAGKSAGSKPSTRPDGGTTSTADAAPLAAIDGGPLPDAGVPTTSGAASDCRIYVNASKGNDDYDGRAWDSAFATLSKALFVAHDTRHMMLACDIWIAKGVYKPSDGKDDARLSAAAFIAVSDVYPNNANLYGGFAGDETSLDQRDLTKNETVLSGDIGIPGDRTDNSAIVIGVNNGTGDSTIVDGLTVSDGVFGLHAQWQPVTIRDCIFENNQNAVQIDGYNHVVTIENSTFRNNTDDTESGSGAAINIGWEKGSSARISNCTFTNNHANAFGGAISVDRGAYIENCTFDSNSVATGQGGAIFAGGSYGAGEPGVTVVHCRFTGNKSENANPGGAVANVGVRSVYVGDWFESSGGSSTTYVQGGEVLFADSVFWKNTGSLAEINNRATVTFTSATIIGPSSSTAFDNTDAITPGFVSKVAINNSIVRNSPVADDGMTTVEHSIVQGGFPGTGNLDVDPMFVDLDHGDFRLQSGSPCIDSASQDLQPADETDLDQDQDLTEAMPFDYDSKPRVVGSSIDQGAFERQQ